MKFRNSFVSNSSSASFIVGIPNSNEDQVLNMLFEQFEHDLLGSYYLEEAIKKDLKYYEKRLAESEKEKIEHEKKSKEDRMGGKNYDPLDWTVSSVKQNTTYVQRQKDLLQELKEIDDKDKKELVRFGLRYYGIGFSPTYKGTKTDKVSEDEEDRVPLDLSEWDKDATDDRDLTFEPIDDADENPAEIIGYQLSDSVTMFNDYGDMPRTLRSMTGVLAFIYKDLRCWVEGDD